MKKSVVSGAFASLLFIVLLFSCNSENKNKNDEPVKIEIGQPAEANQSAQPAHLLNGFLDTLWISAAEFKNLTKKRASFIFYFGSNDTITLHGWEFKGNGIPYNNDPDVKLTKGNPGPVAYSTGTYFGNLSLENIDKIIKKINDSAATVVLFAPQPLFYNHVGYKIYLSKGPHTMLPSGAAIIPTDEDANPSPPKNS